MNSEDTGRQQAYAVPAAQPTELASVNKAATPLGWRPIIGYGLGDLANSLVFSMGMLFLLHYYTDVAGIGAAAAGTMLMAVRIYDAFMDIVAGRLIDRPGKPHRSGRFRPYLLWASLPLLLLNVAVFAVPSNWTGNGKLAYACVTYMLLGTAYSFVNIPYGSLASAMTQSPRERSLLGAARALMGTSAIVLLACVLGPILRNLHGEALQARLTHLTIGLAVAGMLFYFVCFIATRETVERDARHAGLSDSLSTLMSNRPLQLLCIAGFFTLAGVTCMGATTLYFARYVLGDSKYFLTIILLTTLSGTAVSIPLAPALASRYGKRAAFQSGLAIAISAHLCLFWMAAAGPAAILSLLALGSIGTMLAMAIFWALESDSVEYGEWKTGMRLEGLNYSLFSLARKCGQALGGSIPAFLLAGSGYVPNLDVQHPAALQMIRVGVTLAPALAFLIAFLIMLLYPLTDRRYLEMIQEIELRRRN
jgi:glucuronide carrier protein